MTQVQKFSLLYFVSYAVVVLLLTVVVINHTCLIHGCPNNAALQILLVLPIWALTPI